MGAYLAAKSPASYKAVATLRLAGERRALTGDIEPSPELDRSADPILSLVELVRGRNVMGAVVDSLGLRLISLTEDFKTGKLENSFVSPEAAGGDTIQVNFYRNGVKAKHHPVRLERVARRRREQEATAPADQLADRGLNFPTDLRQLVYLRIDRPRQGSSPHDVALDQGGKARCQQGGTHTVKMIQEISKSLRPNKE